MLTLLGAASSNAAEIDSWVSHLSQCKQLTEGDVKRLCEKVLRPSRPSETSLRAIES